MFLWQTKGGVRSSHAERQDPELVHLQGVASIDVELLEFVLSFSALHAGARPELWALRVDPQLQISLKLVSHSA